MPILYPLYSYPIKPHKHHQRSIGGFWRQVGHILEARAMDLRCRRPSKLCLCIAAEREALNPTVDT